MFGILLHVVVKTDNSDYYQAKSYNGKNTIPTGFNGKKATCKTFKFSYFIYIILNYQVLLIAVSIYFYLIKYQTKLKHYLFT